MMSSGVVDFTACHWEYINRRCLCRSETG